MHYWFKHNCDFLHCWWVCSVHLDKCYPSVVRFLLINLHHYVMAISGHGQWKSAWGQSFDQKLASTHFFCNSAVLSFHLLWSKVTIWSPFTDLKKLKNLKSLEYRHVVYQMKAEDNRITMKLCPDKWEVQWLTSGWPSLTSDDLKT